MTIKNSRYGDGGGGGGGYTLAYLSLCAVAEELHSVGTNIILDPCGGTYSNNVVGFPGRQSLSLINLLLNGHLL